MRLFLPLLIILMLPLPAAAAELRLIYTDLDGAPFLSGQGVDVPPQPGMTIELIREAVQGDFTVSLRRVATRRLIEEIRFGNADGILALRYSPERAFDLRFPMRNGRVDESKHIIRLNHSLYQLKGGNLQWDGRALQPNGATIGIPTGFIVREQLQELGANVIEAQTTKQLFAMLAAGRISGVVTIEVAGDLLISSRPAPPMEKLSPAFQAGEFHLAFAQKYYEAHGPAIERLWQRMATLRDATYAKLLPTYLE